MSVCIRIPIAPTAKARPRVVRHNGISMTYTPDKTVDAEERIRWHIKQAGIVPFAEGIPLRVVLHFGVAKPKKPKHKTHPITKPDIDNYVKLVKDAGNGFLWADDSQICSEYSVKLFTIGDPYISISVEVLE